MPSAQPLGGRYVLTVLVVQGMLFALTALLMTRLMKWLRSGERRLMETNRELDRLSQQRRDFLQIALHNLRSPVGAVSMHLNNLSSGHGGELTDQQHAWIERCRERIDELNAFLKDLESLSAVEAGALDKHVQRVELKPLLRGLVDENQDLAQAHDLALRLDITNGVAPVQGIPRLIREAVVNLITNAIKYSLDGGDIVVRAVERGDFVRVEVHDQGVGISEEDQQRLFQEFVRVHKKDPKLADVPGSGLGLFLVRQIVEAHGGRVDLESAPGQGSTFAIDLPAAK